MPDVSKQVAEHLAIHDNTIYLLFSDEQDTNRAALEAHSIVEYGTPSTDEGDYRYVGWTTHYGAAVRWVQEKNIQVRHNTREKV